jgi:cobalt-zinc-cadmium efflux system outer membrane protein
VSLRLATAAFGLAAVFLWPRSGAAQPSALTLEEALALARQRAPALLEAAGHVAEAQGPVAGAAPLLRNNPTLEAQAGPRSLSNGERGVDVAVGLSQPLELGGKQGARRESARAGLARETAHQQDTERLVLGEVASTFLRALHAQERLKLARAAVDAAQETSEAAQRRFDAGDVPVVDVHVARVALARARADVASLEGEEATLRGELHVLLGLPAQPPLSVRGELRALASQPLAPAAGAPVRPDLAALEAELAQAEAELSLGRSSAWPDVSVGLRYQREAQESAMLGTLSVPLPLFSRGQEARVTGEARVRRLRGVLEAARLARDVQVETALTRYRKQQQAVEFLEREALPLLDDNESLARRSYEAGEMNLAEFLLLRRDARETRTAYLDSLLQAALARARLAVETGVLP